MSDLLPFAASPRDLEDSDLVADLRRDLGAETLFFICAIEAALGVQIDHVQNDNAELDESVFEENEQLNNAPLEEAA